MISLKKKGTTIPKNKALRDDEYLKSFDGQRCYVCHSQDGTIVGAHIRFGLGGGMGYKPDDSLAIGLCGNCHSVQSKSEPDFWRDALLHDNFLLMDCVKAFARERYEKWLKNKS